MQAVQGKLSESGSFVCDKNLVLSASAMNCKAGSKTERQLHAHLFAYKGKMSELWLMDAGRCKLKQARAQDQQQTQDQYCFIIAFDDK
jgi:hypothetical protein